MPNLSSLQPVTFKVCDVDVAENLLREISNEHAFTLRMGSIEAHSTFDAPLINNSPHGFVGAVHDAFAYHYPLVISPEHIWLLICQGFAMHVRANAESFRHLFVQHEGKKELEVRRDDFIKGSPNNPWHEVIGEFGQQIKANLVGDTYDWLVPSFSTTLPGEKSIFEVTLMDAMQNYFSYVVTSLCGIPSITLEGTPDDWRDLRERAQRLDTYEMGWWTALLNPLLDEFIKASEGNINIAFWQDIYKYESRSGDDLISGWISRFFPYIESRVKTANGQESQFTRNPYVHYVLNSPLQKFDTGMIGSGLSTAPFLWKYLGESYPMKFVAGFIGVTQNPRTKALRPALGWAIQTVADRDTIAKQIMEALLNRKIDS